MKAWQWRDIPMEQRIAMQIRVNPSTGCHEWVGSKNLGGYGQMKVSGKTVRVHRHLFETAHGRLPPGLYVCHRCDNPACVNVEHLFAGTQRDNALDMVSKGRGGHPRGAEHSRPTAKLTQHSAAMIKRWLAGGERQYVIAERMGLSRATVNDIARNKTWAWL